MEFKLFNSEVLFADFIFSFELIADKTLDLELFDMRSSDLSLIHI